MRAEIIGVGTELLLGQIANTNAQYLSDRLALEGVSVYYHQVVGDNSSRLQEVLSIASRSELIILTGGLGPTEDDLTREGLADFLGKELQLDQQILENLEVFFQTYGRAMPENNRKQAMVIDGARVLENPRGTAPGQYVSAGNRHYVLLPGPPTEMRPMFEEQVVPIVRGLLKETATIRSRVLRIFGIGESALELQVSDIIQRQTNPTVAPYASEGEVTLRITAKANSEEEAFEMIAPVESEIRARLGTYVYGLDDATLPVVVGTHLLQRRETLVVAESCTGGMVSSLLTDIPGSSDYFMQSWITYTNQAKMQELQVPIELLEQYGAVSDKCAMAMADGARKNGQADWAIATTGIAGPSGGTEEKPVGLVYIAVSGPSGTTVKEHRFRGDRNQVRIRTSKYALHALIHRIITERTER